MKQAHGSVKWGLSLIATLTIILHLPAVGEIQNDLPGFTPTHVFDGAIKGENVDVMTGNVSLSIPLGPRYSMNDWFSYQLMLHYNSKVWDNECDSSLAPSNPNYCKGRFTNPDTYGLGVNLHMGRIQRHPSEKPTVFRYQAPSGGTHFVVFDDNSTDTDAYTTDQNSYLVKRGGSDLAKPDWFEIHFGDGRIARFDHLVGDPTDTEDLRGEGVGWYATRIRTVVEDGANPLQYVDIHYAPGPGGLNSDEIDYIEDKFLRKIDFKPTGSGVEIDFPSANGVATYELVIAPGTARDPYRPDPENPVDKDTQFLTNLYVPELEVLDDEYHTFGYSTSGNLNSWKLPTGAEMKYFHRYFSTSSRKPLNAELYAKELHLDGEVYAWTYSRFGTGLITDPDDVDPQAQPSLSASNPAAVRVLDPLNNLTVYRFHFTEYTECHAADGCIPYFSDGLLRETALYSGPAENDAYLVRREAYQHVHDGGQWAELRQVSSPANEHRQSVAINVLQERTTTTVPGGGIQPSKVIERESSDWAGTNIRRPKLTKEYRGGELYRYTKTGYAPVDDNHNKHAYVETYDKNGQKLSRTDKQWLDHRVECTVTHADASANPIADCGSLSPPVGAVAKIYTFDTEGSIWKIETKGGDSNPITTHKTNYLVARGVVESAAVDGWTWDLFRRDIDPATGLVTTSYDSTGEAIDYEWDDLGRLTRIVPDPPEEPTVISYDSVTQTTVSQVRSAQNYSEDTYLYDGLGRLIEQKRRNREDGVDTQRTVYDILGRVLKQSTWSPDGTPDIQRDWTIYDYNLFPNPNAGAPGEPAFLTDPLGRMSRVTRPDGTYTDTEYDGLLTRVTTHDIEGDQGPMPSVTEYLNDALGRLVSVDSPDPGADAVYSYDEQDRLVRVELVDPATPENVQVRTFQYDKLGRLRFANNPENGTVEYQKYDDRGKLIEYRDAVGNSFTNTYDGAGRLTDKSANGWTVVDNRYDETGRGASVGKLTTQFSYQVQDDSQTLVQTKRYYYGNVSESGTCQYPPTAFMPETAYGGLNGRLKTVEVEIAPWAQTLPIDLCQNDLGGPATVEYPDEDIGRTISLASVRLKNGFAWEVADLQRDLEYVSDVLYDSNGAITKIRRGNALSMQITRDSQGRPIEFGLWRKSGSTRHSLQAALGCGHNTAPGVTGVDVMACYQPGETTFEFWAWGPYAYDGAGNIKTIGWDSFKYDRLNRLVEANLNNDITSTFGLDYTYDGFGNMTQRKKEIGVGTGNFDTQDFTVDWDTNQLVQQTFGSGTPTPYGFDANGNMASDNGRQFVFGPLNRLQEVWDPGGEQVAEYSYDASGYRVRSVVKGVETFFVRDESGQLLSEFRRADGDSVSPGWNKDYVYALGQAVSVVNNTLPSLVTQPWATAVSSSGVTVNWNDPGDPDITRYRITRNATMPAGQDPKIFNVMAPTTLRVDSLAQLTVDPDNVVTYWVTAIDAALNEGPKSPLLVVRPFDSSPAGQPTGIDAVPLDRAVRVTWSAPSGPKQDDIAGYYVWRKIEDGNWEKITPNPITTTEYVDFGLTNGTTYHYKVVAVDTGGNESDISQAAEDSAEPEDNVKPAPPFGVEASPGFAALEVVVSWNPNVDDDVSLLRICRSTDSTAVPCDDTFDLEKNIDPEFAAGEMTDAVPSTTPVYYYITAYDTSGNFSEWSQVVSATPREPAWEVPGGLLAEFWVDVHGNPGAALTNPDCTMEEADHEITVKLSWTFDDSTSATDVRVYRSRQGEEDYIALATVDGSGKEFIDRTPVYHAYDYYIVSTTAPADARESAAAGPFSVTDEIDDPTTLYPANVIGFDGIDLDYFDTDNALSRAVQVQWTRIPESKVIGYHIYRKCEWDYCADWAVTGTDAGRDHFACENSWVRLTDNPITTGVTYEDFSVGGLSGCFTYAVTAVQYDGTEGPFGGKVLAINTSEHNVNTIKECNGQYNTAAHTVTSGQYSRETYISMQDEFDRINNRSAGQGDPAGAPPAPYVFVRNTSLPTEQAWGERTPDPYQEPSSYIRLQWEWLPTEADAPADLRGYHIERAGSLAGPWQRLTKYPVAWFETDYYVRGFDIDMGSEELPDSSCAHFRVLAVDENGNESPPAYPDKKSYSNPPEPLYPLNGCDTGPTLSAPTNLVVSDTTVGGSCAYELTWDDITLGDLNYSNYEYSVYRYAIPEVFSVVPYFYVTEKFAASDARCDGVDCTYVEAGDPYDSEDPWHCPWYTESVLSQDDPCPLNGNLQAFYVTIKSPTGGESPRSDVVFWECDQNPGYARVDQDPIPGRLSPYEPLAELTGLAQANLPVSPTLEFALYDRPVMESLLEPEECEVAVEDSGDLIAGLLTLGESPTNPPVEILDIHVDHLGSTRVTTDDSGNIVAEHNFMPFGEEILPMADSLTKMFTGHERDAETGLDYMFARYYSSSVARFLSVDPASLSASPAVPESWTRYRYAMNNPLGFNDPDGRVAFDALGDEGKNQVNDHVYAVTKALRSELGSEFNPGFMAGHKYEYMENEIVRSSTFRFKGTSAGLFPGGTPKTRIPLKNTSQNLLRAELFLAGYNESNPGLETIVKGVEALGDHAEELDIGPDILLGLVAIVESQFDDPRMTEAVAKLKKKLDKSDGGEKDETPESKERGVLSDSDRPGDNHHKWADQRTQ